ncbi:MAG: cytidine deaminase [Mogibacterium sp.]|nr:cytidine deaminase [Mogibacterium sp.]
MKLSTDEKHRLISAAVSARTNAYAPYSRFKVGAAVMASSGRIYSGAYVENASYPCGICAERNAIAHAAAEGERVILAVALTGGPEDKHAAKEAQDYCTPCGICRQFMREFADPAELIVISARSETDYRERTLEQLLPESFGPDSM